MKQSTSYILLIVVLSVVLSDSATAQSRMKIPAPDLINWSDEKLDQWEDSVKNVLYPTPETKRRLVTDDKNEDVKNDPAGEGTTTSPANTMPLSVSIDQSKAVGQIPIIPGTSPTGAATYQVPVNVHPGPKGIQPQIALAYNSSGSNGPLGMGWGISGISKIIRISKSVHYDTTVEGITREKDDAFMLDGMRLIKTSSTSTYIRYESEQGNIRAIAYLNGNVVKFFEVLYPNGQKGIFGYPTNTYSQYLEYPLTKLTDLQGNEIVFNYLDLNNRFLISSITYGDNGGASIVFSYQTGRSDPVVAYRGGLKVTEDRLLQKIDCKYGSTVLHSYGLEYANERSSSVINKITYTAGSESFNPLVFSYGTGAYQSDYDQSTTQLYEWYVTGDNPGQVTITKGKFDYGSDDDGLISYPFTDTYWHHYRNPTWIRKRQNRYDNLYTGDEKIFFYAGLKDEMASPMPTLTTGTGFITIFCANVDGKYEEEVVKVNNVVYGNNDQLTFKAYTPNLYSGLSLKYTRTYNFPTVLTDEDGGKSIHPKYYFAGDFNGNGKMEVLAVSNHHPLGDPNRTSKCYLFDLESNSKLYEGYVFPHVVDFVGVNQTDRDAAFQNTDRLFVMDYDGDGKSDVCHINDQGINIYTFDINGTSYSMRKVATYTGLKKPGLADRNLLPGEFDGDGLIDLLLSPLSGYGWDIYHSTGDGQFYKTTFSGTSNSTGANNGFLLQDVNGDGLTDLIKYSSSGFFTYLTKNGTPSSSEDYESKPYYSALVPTNITSRNVFNQLIAIKDGVATKFRFQRDDTRERMLSAAVNSLGAVYQNDYQKLNDESSSFYSKGAGATFPFENFNGPLWAISTQDVWLEGQKKESTSYSYHNAVIHKQGLGFRGFGKISAYDNIRYRSASSEINPYNYSVPVKDETHFARNTYEYSVSVLPDKRVKVRLTGKTAYDKIRNSTTVSTYTHDTYGNVLTQTDNSPGSITVKNTNVYSNSTSDGSYLLGFPYDQTTTTTRGGASSSVRQYIQNHSKGLPIKVITYIDGNKTGELNYTYDSFGKVESVEKQRFSSVFLTTNYDYDSFGHLVSETDPMGFTSTWHYNTGGLLDYSKNYKDHQTDYSYDEFGRLKTTTSPLDFVAETTYEWDAAGTGGLYTITQTSTGQATQKTWYDAFGREVRQAMQRFDGLWAKTDTKYDNYGRLEKSSLPFTGSNATYWATYVYDGYDRPLSVTEASGKKTTHSYNGYKVSTTSEGITTGRTYDALGTLVESEDPGGTLTYNLRPDGQPRSIAAPGGVTTAFTYDMYGRQDTLMDPSAGLVIYKYDISGNLKQQIDAEGRVTEMEYDDYGRITTKSSPEMTTTYNYKPNDNLLESKTSSNGTSTVYDYDTYGRLIYARETGTDGLGLTINYYHSLVHGNLFGIIYKTSGGETFNEQYSYNYGHRTEIKQGATSIWKLTAQNALGQPTGATTGPVTRAYSFDDYGLPTGRSAGAILDAGYGFETATGNLLNRKDKKRNKTENFLYDGLNRLTNFGNYTTDYDSNGNLLEKTDAGTFYYNTPDKPYAMSGADLTSSAVPQRHQQINYTSFKQPHDISENNHLATFTYNAEGQRVKMELKENGQVKLVRHYLGGCYEKDTGVGGTKEKLYLGGDYYSAPAVYVKQGSGNWQLYYICRDYLGSVTHLASSTGSLTQELSFDAWGRLRDPVTQTAYDPGSEPALFLGRGYTGHEHLPEFGLINMNGRLYDPAVGRFLSPDNFVQLPDFSQSYNRYAYALNNPLKYTDPDGEWIEFVIAGAIILGKNYFDGKKANNQEPNPFKWDWSRAFYMVGNNSSLDGSSSTWSLGIGWSPEALPAIGHNNNDGFGAGYWSPDGVNLGYPKKQTTSPEEKVNQEIKEVRQDYGAAWHSSGEIGMGLPTINGFTAPWNNELIINKYNQVLQHLDGTNQSLGYGVSLAGLAVEDIKFLESTGNVTFFAGLGIATLRTDWNNTQSVTEFGIGTGLSTWAYYNPWAIPFAGAYSALTINKGYSKTLPERAAKGYSLSNQQYRNHPYFRNLHY